MNKTTAVALITGLAKAGISTEVRVNHHEGGASGNWIVAPTGNNIDLLSLGQVADKLGLVATISKIDRSHGTSKVEFRKKP